MVIIERLTGNDMIRAMKNTFFTLTTLICLSGCWNEINGSSTNNGSSEPQTEIPANASLATFAGGCFWCVETPFEKLEGVYAVISGFSGGPEDNPTYKDVAHGRTGHTEVVQIHFDPTRISYDILLQVFWRQINPTDGGGQFVDRGPQYRAEIFYHDEQQKEAALKSKAELEASGRFRAPIVTAITAYEKFFPAEEYHQDFYKKSPAHYHRYRNGSGRDKYIQKTWGDDAVYPKAREKTN